MQHMNKAISLTWHLPSRRSSSWDRRWFLISAGLRLRERMAGLPCGGTAFHNAALSMHRPSGREDAPSLRPAQDGNPTWAFARHRRSTKLCCLRLRGSHTRRLGDAQLLPSCRESNHNCMHERSRCIGALTVSSGAACGKNLKHKNLLLCMPHHCASGSSACSCERHRYVIWTTDATSVTSGSSFDPELAAVADMLAAKSSHGSWLQLESLEGGTLPAQCKATCLDRLIRCRLSTLRHNNPQ